MTFCRKFYSAVGDTHTGLCDLWSQGGEIFARRKIDSQAGGDDLGNWMRFFVRGTNINKIRYETVVFL